MSVETMAAPDAVLTEGQAAALDNLARKRAGHEVGWIQISAAQALTELGFARRTPEGWIITAEGLVALASAPNAAAGATAAIPLRKPTPRRGA